MKITSQGHLWVEVSHDSREFSLSYNHGIDATVIFEYVEGNPLKYINYFHGGFNLRTGKHDTDFLKIAMEFIL